MSTALAQEAAARRPDAKDTQRGLEISLAHERQLRLALEKKNAELERQLDLITSAIPGGIKVSNDDETYSFKYVSEQFAQMLGYENASELVAASGGAIVGLAHPEDADAAIADALSQYETSSDYATTYRLRCKDGSWKYVEDHGRKFTHSDGTVEHWNLFIDKNELVRKSIELESERRANQAKSDFLSRMSHDMRTPLNGIIGLLDICSKHPDDRDLVDSSREKAMVAATHLRSLINDTLELSKLENDEVPLYEEAFNAKTVIREVATIAQMRAEEEGITLTGADCEGSIEHPYLIGCPLHIKQIALNLITNSIKYNKKGGSVHCSVAEHVIGQNEVEIEFVVEDTGIGMSEEFLNEVFEPFVQADHSARTTYQGTGLGMAIVKNLLDRMGGSIDIDSELGRGTRTTVRLPFTIAARGKQTPKYRAAHFIDLAGLRILLAEDNDLNREIATFMLHDEGIEVTEAVDGEEVVRIFEENPAHSFDAILMDIMMPKMDGRQAARAIRKCGKADAETVPIIAMTANAFDDDKHRSREAGMDEHLSKPIDSAELTRTLAKIFKQRKYAGDAAEE